MLSAVVLDNQQVMPATFLLRLQAPDLALAAQPGQFAMVRCAEEGALDPFLRRPLAFHRIDRVRGEVELLLRVVGRGTAWLATRRPGDGLDLMGPLGQGFSLRSQTEHLLLIAGGMGIAPLKAIAEQALGRGCAVVLALGARSRHELYPSALLPPQIELHLATDDGSAGVCGPVISLLSSSEPALLDWADQLMACGPRPMLACLPQVIQAGRLLWQRDFAQVSLEERMACGVGACLGCVVPTRWGMKRACRDGPVFDLKDVLWD